MVEQNPRPQRREEQAPGGDSLMRRAKQHHDEQSDEQTEKEAKSHPQGFSPVETSYAGSQDTPPQAQVFDTGSPVVHKQQEVQLPTILDSQGQVYDQRPDVIIMNYAKKANLDEDEYSAVQHYLGMRKWTELRSLLATLYRKREGDEAIRLEKAISTLDNIQR